jgi:hypothetical protein
VKDKIVYFVVGVDLTTGKKHIDDEMLMSRFDAGQVWNTETQEWEKETDEEYQFALDVLNNGEWEKE